MPNPDKASLQFLAEECRRIVRMQFEAGSELSGKAEAVVKASGLVLGLLVTALGWASAAGWSVPPGPPPVQAALLWGGPTLLLLAMLLASWAFRAVGFEVGLLEDDMVDALEVRLTECELLLKAVTAYREGIRTNKASVGRVERLLSWALASLAAGVALSLCTAISTWIGD